MSLKIITVGDSTDHGGKVISGSPRHDIGVHDRFREPQLAQHGDG